VNHRRFAKIGALSVSLLCLMSAPTVATASGDHRGGYTFAVIGDIPYGDPALVTFPQAVEAINDDRRVKLVAHLGDIKSGSTLCSDSYYNTIRENFDHFEDPLVYTIGDNEWTDCHRTNNGAFNPLERLGTVRRTFFDDPGFTLGEHRARVLSQDRQGYPENVQFTRQRVSFGAVHIVGSNNGLQPWTNNTQATPEQTAEVLGRTAAAIQLIRDTFDSAKQHNHRAVVLMTQADMFDPTVKDPKFADYYAFQPIVAAIAQESADFGRPVYLFNGDSHVYNEDAPLAAGSKWVRFYGVDTPVANLTRVTVDGAADATEYLRVRINPRRGSVLSWTRVPYGS